MSFWSWYTQVLLPGILEINFNFYVFVDHYFSFGRISSTLLSPWKRQVSVKKSLGFSDILDELSFNLISRFIGMWVRLFTLLAGLVVFVLGASVLAVISIICLLFPFLLVSQYAKDSRNLGKYKSAKNYPDVIDTWFESEFAKFLISRGQLNVKDLNQILLAAPVDIYSVINKAGKVEDEEVFLALFKASPQLTAAFADKQLENQDVITLVNWWQFIKGQKKIWGLLNKDHLLSIPSIGKTWSAGYTPNLDAFSRDLSVWDWRKYIFTHREEEMTRLVSELSRKDNPRVMLVGDPGIGRHSLVYALTKGIQWHQFQQFKHFRVVLFEPEKFLSQTNPREAPFILEKMLIEAAKAGNVILVIDNCHELFLNKSQFEFQLEDVMANAWQQFPSPIIAITDKHSFDELLRLNKTLMKLFTPMEITPMNTDDALWVVLNKALTLEAGDQVFFPYLTLKKTVQLTDDYMKAEVFPEKALNILAEAVMLAKQQKLTTVPTGIVEAAISQRTGIPIGQAGADDRKRLLNLETELKSRVVEQDEALTVIAKAMRRNRAKVGSVNRPMGVFLFLGPTGVGKTATAKALAEVCFREEKLMRFDMAEYQTNESVIRLIGSFENKQIGLMAEQILSSPYGLLLLDEFEKAPRQVHNIFLTIFDEGYFTTADGRKIDCTNLIIIATSNAGSEKLRELINAGNTDIENTMTDYLLSQNMFSPELLNRFDALVYFKPLSHQGLVNVAMMMLKEIQDQMEKRSHVSIKFAPGLAAKIIDEGYSPDFGARSIRRYIQDEITDQIAKKLLENPDTKVVEI